MPPEPARLRLAPELSELITSARAEIDRAIDLGGLRNDPIRHALTALATHLDALYRVLTDATLTIGAQLEEARRPIADEDIRKLSKASADGAWRATAGMVRAHIWRSILITVAASLLLLIGAFGAGYWFHGSQQLVAGVSAGGQECHAQQGGTICFIPVWARVAAVDGAIGARFTRDNVASQGQNWPRRTDHCGLMCEPPTMNSVSREPQLPQRHFICTNGTSPRPASIRTARSASFACRHALHQTCTR
jgi:hypothetical protein